MSRGKLGCESKAFLWVGDSVNLVAGGPPFTKDTTSTSEPGDNSVKPVFLLVES